VTCLAPARAGTATLLRHVPSMPVVRARCSGPGISRHTPAGVREGAAREHAGSILAEMSIAALRRAPPAVLAVLLVSTATISYGLAQASPKFWQHPVRPALVILLLVLWLAAVVLWRQRWAWALSLIASGVASRLACGKESRSLRLSATL
jgi:hypothetical protein